MRAKTHLAVMFLAVAVIAASFSFISRKVEEKVYFNQIAKQPPTFLLADIGQKYKHLFRCPEISAKSALAVKFKKGSREIVFEKNKTAVLPIASLTKIMTALTAEEIYPKEKLIKVSAQAIKQPEEAGSLKVGESLKVEDLIRIMLVESSNDAAYALAEAGGEIKTFVERMNEKARQLGLKNTKYFNPTGLDLESQDKKQYNFSTTEDLIKIGEHLLFRNKKILSFLSENNYPLYNPNGSLHHILRNTNLLLGKIKGIIGGKTGWTESARGCLLILLKCRSADSYLVAVVLGSEDRFSDMEKIIQYVKRKHKCN